MGLLPSTVYLYCDDSSLLQLQRVCKSIYYLVNGREFISLFLPLLTAGIHTEAHGHDKFQSIVASLSTSQSPLSTLIKARAKHHFSLILSRKILSPEIYLMRCCEYGIVPDTESVDKMKNVDHGTCLLLASTYGHLPVLDALDRIRYDEDDYWRVVNNVFKGACQQDRVEVYEWLDGRYSACPQGGEALDLCVTHGATKIFKLVFSKYHGVRYVFFDDIMRSAIEHERDEIIEVMLAGGKYYVFQEAAQAGKLRLVKKYESTDTKARYQAMEAAIYNDHHDAVQYLHDATTFDRSVQDRFVVAAACASRRMLGMVQGFYPNAVLNVEQALVECVERGKDKKDRTKFLVGKASEEERCRVIINMLAGGDYVDDGWVCLRIIALSLPEDIVERYIQFASNPDALSLFRRDPPRDKKKKLGRRGRRRGRERERRKKNEEDMMDSMMEDMMKRRALRYNF